jgi:hypothetical protein
MVLCYVILKMIDTPVIKYYHNMITWVSMIFRLCDSKDDWHPCDFNDRYITPFVKTFTHELKAEVKPVEDVSLFCQINSTVFELCSKNVELIWQKGKGSSI